MATQYFVGAASIGCTGVVQANQEEPGVTLHLSVRDIWEMLEPSTYSHMTGIYADGEPLESVDSFCYLGDMLGAGGGCESAVITRGRTAWGKYRDLLPILSSKNVALRTKGRVYDTCIRSAMLYGSETWTPRNTDLDRLQRNERGMTLSSGNPSMLRQTVVGHGKSRQPAAQ